MGTISSATVIEEPPLAVIAATPAAAATSEKKKAELAERLLDGPNYVAEAQVEAERQRLVAEERKWKRQQEEDIARLAALQKQRAVEAETARRFLAKQKSQQQQGKGTGKVV